MIRNTCSVRLCHGPLSLPRNVSVVFAMRRILCADSGTGGKGPRYSASVPKGVLQLCRESVGIERPGPAAQRHVDIVIVRDEEFAVGPEGPADPDVGTELARGVVVLGEAVDLEVGRQGHAQPRAVALEHKGDGPAAPHDSALVALAGQLD